VKNSADGLIYTTEKALEEYSTLLPAKDMAEIRADLEALKKVVGSEDLPRIKAAVQRLEGSAYRIADALYSTGDSATRKPPPSLEISLANPKNRSLETAFSASACLACSALI